MTDTRVGKERRRRERRRYERNRVRVLTAWLVVVTGLWVYALISLQTQADVQREGRKAAVGVTCATTTAIIDAGRATITGAQALPPKFERNLERLGYPSKEQREDAARVAGRAYGDSIVRAVRREIGNDAAEVVNPDGSLNCDALQDLSKTK